MGRVTLLTPFGAFVAPTDEEARRLAVAANVGPEHHRRVVPRRIQIAYDDTYEVLEDRVRLHPHLTLTQLLFSPEELHDHVRAVARRYFGDEA